MNHQTPIHNTTAETIGLKIVMLYFRWLQIQNASLNNNFFTAFGIAEFSSTAIDGNTPLFFWTLCKQKRIEPNRVLPLTFIAVDTFFSSCFFFKSPLSTTVIVFETNFWAFLHFKIYLQNKCSQCETRPRGKIRLKKCERCLRCIFVVANCNGEFLGAVLLNYLRHFF